MSKVPSLILPDADLCIGWNTGTPRRSARDWVHQAERQCEPLKSSERQHEPWNQHRSESRWWQPNHEEAEEANVGVLCPHKCELAFRDDDAREGWGKYRRGFVPSVQLGSDGRGIVNLFVCLRDDRDSALQTGNAGLGRFAVSITKGPAEIVSSTESLKHVDVAEVYFSVVVRAISSPSKDGLAFWLNIRDRVTGRHVRRSPRRVRASWSTPPMATTASASKECDAAVIETQSSTSAVPKQEARNAAARRPADTSWSQLLNAPQKPMNKIVKATVSTSVVSPAIHSCQSEPCRPEQKGISTQKAVALQILGDLRTVHKDLTREALSLKRDAHCEILSLFRSNPKYVESLNKKRHDFVELLVNCFRDWADVCRRSGRIKDDEYLKGFDACFQKLLNKDASKPSATSQVVAKCSSTTPENVKVSDAVASHVDLSQLEQRAAREEHTGEVTAKQVQKRAELANADENWSCPEAESCTDLQHDLLGTFAMAPAKEASVDVKLKPVVALTNEVMTPTRNLHKDPEIGNERISEKTAAQLEEDKARKRQNRGSVEVIVTSDPKSNTVTSERKSEAGPNRRVDPDPELPLKCNQSLPASGCNATTQRSSQGPSNLLRKSGGTSGRVAHQFPRSSSTIGSQSCGVRGGALSRMSLETFPSR